MRIFYCYMSFVEQQTTAFPLPEIREKIWQELKKAGHELLLYSYELGDKWNDQGYKEGPHNVFASITKADVFIGEMSYPSQTLGFLLAYAIQHGKPSLYLYPDDTPGKPAAPVFFNPSRLLTIKSFDPQGALKAVNGFLRRAQKQLRSDRTTFVTTRYINDYLKWKVQQSGLSKGEVIRGILESSIESTSEYTKGD